MLKSVLARARMSGREAGDAQYLRRYARMRRAQASLMMAGMDGIQRVFSSRSPLVQAARNVGLGVVDRLAPLKQFFIQQAIAGPDLDEPSKSGWGASD